MAKRSSPPPSRTPARPVAARPVQAPSTPAAAGPVVEPITEKNIDRIEANVIKEVSRTISTLESGLAKWDGLDNKPDDLVPDFERYKKFHDELENWEATALRSIGKPLTFEQRMERLRDFVRICYAYT
jgi:hypothetical protein